MPQETAVLKMRTEIMSLMEIILILLTRGLSGIKMEMEILTHILKQAMVKNWKKNS